MTSPYRIEVCEWEVSPYRRHRGWINIVVETLSPLEALSQDYEERIWIGRDMTGGTLMAHIPSSKLLTVTPIISAKLAVHYGEWLNRRTGAPYVVAGYEMKISPAELRRIIRGMSPHGIVEVRIYLRRRS